MEFTWNTNQPTSSMVINLQPWCSILYMPYSGIDFGYPEVVGM